MKVVQFAKASLVWLVLALAAATMPCPARAENALSAGEVIAKAVARAQKAEATTAPAGVTYTKITVTEAFDTAGNVKEHKERVYHVMFQDGSTYLKLEQVNGRPPDAAELKLHAENEANFRLLSRQPRSAKGDNRENLLSPDLVARFDFTLVTNAPIAGRMAYQIAFRPKNPLPPAHHIADHFLSRISGIIWIDAEEFEIARAEIGLSSEVDLLGGTVGCLKKLAYTLNRTRIGEGLWINTSSSGNIEGRKLLDSVRIKTNSRAVNFRALGLPS
jgi:hypothetical protein